MENLHIGDSVLTRTSSGQLMYTDIVGFTQFNTDIGYIFVRLETESGHSVTTTYNHLIFSHEYPQGTSAKNIRVGDRIWVKSTSDSMILSAVVAMKNSTQRGLISPLTMEGSLLVDGVLMSCYGFEDSLVGHRIGHAVYAPMRWLYGVRKYTGMSLGQRPANDPSFDEYGAHWYRTMLKNVYTRAKSVL